MVSTLEVDRDICPGGSLLLHVVLSLVHEVAEKENPTKALSQDIDFRLEQNVVLHKYI